MQESGTVLAKVAFQEGMGICCFLTLWQRMVSVQSEATSMGRGYHDEGEWNWSSVGDQFKGHAGQARR